jgi:hypothetical protein
MCFGSCLYEDPEAPNHCDYQLNKSWVGKLAKLSKSIPRLVSGSGAILQITNSDDAKAKLITTGEIKWLNADFQ